MDSGTRAGRPSPSRRRRRTQTTIRRWRRRLSNVGRFRNILQTSCTPRPLSRCSLRVSLSLLGNSLNRRWAESFVVVSKATARRHSFGASASSDGRPLRNRQLAAREQNVFITLGPGSFASARPVCARQGSLRPVEGIARAWRR